MHFFFSLLPLSCCLCPQRSKTYFFEWCLATGFCDNPRYWSDFPPPPYAPTDRFNTQPAHFHPIHKPLHHTCAARISQRSLTPVCGTSGREVRCCLENDCNVGISRGVHARGQPPALLLLSGLAAVVSLTMAQG